VGARTPFITTDEMIHYMHAAVTDTEHVPVSAQPFLRFFTRVCRERLDVYRHALGKLLNSLSSNAQTKLPAPIDPEGTIYRIDLRDYGWAAKDAVQTDVWDLLVDRNPFAVEYEGDETAQHNQLTAGFQESGVSEQNRVIERHQIVDEAVRVYWISYDFLSNVGLGDIFTHPLDFVEGGGEIIWNLPNELQAYWRRPARRRPRPLGPRCPPPRRVRCSGDAAIPCAIP
jgi:hypothetical protein